MGCVYGGMEKSGSGISESASETAGTGEAFIPDGYIEKMIPVGDKGYFVKPRRKVLSPAPFEGFGCSAKVFEFFSRF